MRGRKMDKKKIEAGFAGAMQKAADAAKEIGRAHV